VNLNYEDEWVENSRVLSLYEKKNYAWYVFYRKVVERLYGNVKSSRKYFKKFWSKGRYERWTWSKKDGTEGFKNVKLTMGKQWGKA